jgi:hypothetical protein
MQCSIVVWTTFSIRERNNWTSRRIDVKKLTVEPNRAESHASRATLGLQKCAVRHTMRFIHAVRSAQDKVYFLLLYIIGQFPEARERLFDWSESRRPARTNTGNAKGLRRCKRLQRAEVLAQTSARGHNVPVYSMPVSSLATSDIIE